MEEIFKSIKATLYDRAVSPLSGAFVISWLIWNHDFLLVFFSDMDAGEKISYINTYIFGSSYQCLVNGIVWPLLITSFYIYAYPFLSIPVYRFSLNRQLKLNQIRQRIEANKFLTLEQSVTLRQEISLLREASQKELNDKDAEILVLKSKLEGQEYMDTEQNGKKEEISVLESDGHHNSSEQSNIKLSSLEEDILKEFISQGKEIGENVLRKAVGKKEPSPVRLERALYKMMNEGYISGTIDFENNRGFELKLKGMDYIVEHNLDRSS